MRWNQPGLMLAISALWAGTCLGAPPQQPPKQQEAVTLTLRLVHPTVRVGATNIPIKVVIENTTTNTISFAFAPGVLVGGQSAAAYGHVEVVLPTNANVRWRQIGGIHASVDYVALKPGDKYVGDFDLGDFLEPLKPGECEIVARPVGIRYARADGPKDPNATGLMTGESRLRLKVTE